jgi:GNAT superfamily N-acetyltransferase
MKYSLSAKNLVCRNLESRASYCADLLNPNQCKEITGVLRADSGLLSHTFNQVVSNAVMPTQIIKRFVVDYFAERHSPFTLWHCASKSLDESALAEIGLQRQDTLIAMAVDIPRLAADDKRPAELEIVPVSPEEIAAYGELVAEQCGDANSDPREIPQVKKFYRKLQEFPEHKRSRLKLYLAKWDGKPAACGCLFSSADALGFYDLCTSGEMRGRGIGRAMLQHLIGEVVNSHHKHAVALTPEDKQEIYLNAGFFAVGEVTRYRFEPQRS